MAAAAFAALLAFTPMVLSLDKPEVVSDDTAAWHRRHERNSSECRGQQYVAQCCTDARTDLTCINANMEQK